MSSTCPSCGAPMIPQAILCMRCGFNLKTGQRTKSAPQQAPTDESGSKKVFILIALILLLGLSATIGGLLISGHGPGKKSRAMLGDDQYVEDQLTDGVSGEVNKWLDATPRHMVMGMNNKQAKALADKWTNEMGAKQVVAFGAVMSMSLAIELPDDPAKRKHLFDWEHEHHYDFTKPAAKDVGQKWLLIRMHP